MMPCSANDDDAPVQHTPPRGASLSYKAVRGVAWTTIGTAVERAASVVGQIVLAYLLIPDQFGWWGVVASVLTLAGSFQTSGMKEVLVHRSARFARWANASMWLSGAIGLGWSLALVAAAWPLATIYGGDGGFWPIFWASIAASPTPLLQGLIVTPRASLSIEHRFRALAETFVWSSLAQHAATITLAALGLGVLAFAIAYPIGALVKLVLMLRASSIHLRAGPQFSRWKYLLGDTGLVWGYSAGKWLRNQGDVLIIGVFVDAAALGVYVFARNMSRQVMMLVTQQVAGVLQPVLAAIQSEPERQRRAFLRAARLLAYIGMPFSLATGAIMWPGTPLLLQTDKWGGLPPVLTVMSVGVALRLLTESSVSLQFATGRFKEQFWFSVWTSALFVSAVGAGARLGDIMGASLGFVAFCVIAGPAQIYDAIRDIGGTWSDVVRCEFKPLLLAAVSIMPWIPVVQSIPGSGRAHEAGMTALLSAVAACSYLAASMLVRSPELPDLIARAHEQAPKRFRPILSLLSGPIVRAAGRGG